MAQAVKEPVKQADFLFVQTAQRMSFDKSANKLTLEGVSSTTLFFSDRPERIAGNMKTTAFVPFWTKGQDSFLKDPPNADISIVERQSPPGRGRTASSGAEGRFAHLQRQGFAG